MTNPNEPTLTCSEVVERLATECVDVEYAIDEVGGYHKATFDRDRATAILHSWRERRVQELEELLAKQSLSPELSSTQPDTTKEKE